MTKLNSLLKRLIKKSTKVQGLGLVVKDDAHEYHFRYQKWDLVIGKKLAGETALFHMEIATDGIRPVRFSTEDKAFSAVQNLFEKLFETMKEKHQATEDVVSQVLDALK